MYFEILVEDQSGKALLEEVVPRIVADAAVRPRIMHYKGIGALPKDLRAGAHARTRALLNNLPRLLRGYGQTPGIDALVVVMDSDRRDCGELLSELQSCAAANLFPVRAVFRIAIEETEAWLLSDRDAVLRAYPRAKRPLLERYEPDSICDTWEMLADAVHPGGRAALGSGGYAETGALKSEWARKIGPQLDLANPKSPSFRKLLTTLRDLAAA